MTAPKPSAETCIYCDGKGWIPDDCHACCGNSAPLVAPAAQSPQSGQSPGEQEAHAWFKSIAQPSPTMARIEALLTHVPSWAMLRVVDNTKVQLNDELRTELAALTAEHHSDLEFWAARSVAEANCGVELKAALRRIVETRDALSIARRDYAETSDVVRGALLAHIEAIEDARGLI